MSTTTHSITAPASVAFPVTDTIPIPGIVINDPTAAAAPGSVALDLTCSSGELNVPTYTSARSLTLTGTLAQVNAAVAKLSYTAALPFTGDAITTQFWPQTGVPYPGPMIPITAGPAVPVAPVSPPATPVTPSQPVAPAVPPVSAARVQDFAGTLMVNTHLDFGVGAPPLVPQYSDLAAVARAVDLIWGQSGLPPKMRDSPGAATDPALWSQFAALCKPLPPRFCAYIGETSAAGMAAYLPLMTQLATDGLLFAIEGGNEEDDDYPASLGNTLAATAAMQQQVWALGQKLGLPVLNMSFGSGWTAANGWRGDYDKVGDLSAYCTYANAHTYPNGNQSPLAQITLLTADALLAAPGRPVVHSEFGYPTGVGLDVMAKQALAGWGDAFANGCPLFGIYALCDDTSGNWGMFNADWSPRPLAMALSNLMGILADTGPTAATFTPSPLAYTLPGCRTIPLAYSDGSHAILAWKEATIATGQNPVTGCTLTLGVSGTVQVIDPLSGATVGAITKGVTATVGVPVYPVVIRVG